MCSEKATSKFKQLRHSYGFDEVAIVPGDITINPDQTNVDFSIGDFTFTIPVIAADMDSVTDVDMVVRMGKLGGLAILNLDGIQARYENPDEILDKIAQSTDDDVTALLQKIYQEPIKEKLIGERVEAIKKAEKDKKISKDDRFKGEEQMQKLTERYVKLVDGALAAKEKDIMSE